ncbi:iron-containing alcohol dehydrogenase [Halobaculum sp. MBLA0143]|uniref:iron-containing alcohol dehydrogenase n=1 Tax=Halobaculum sp. MBLA0143 TaxID=3079933 RepID=UPI003525D05A
MHTEPFAFDYRPARIEYGRGAADGLADLLAALDCSRALVVCGDNTGRNRALMDPVEAGLGDARVDTFVGTTPDKRAATAAAVADRAAETDADALVPVGGGSSLDVATVAATLRADDRDLAAVRETVAETGGVTPPSGDRPALVPVPTTLAGASLSGVAGITVQLDDQVVATGVGDPGLMPEAAVFDPALFETTPQSVLAGSAFNGLNKAVESTYAADRTPVTDATARRALAYFDTGLPALFDGDDGYDAAAVDRVVAGLVLAQYGVARPETTTLNVLHAFGHALRDVFDLQQGVAHAVVAPHALRRLFAAGVSPTPSAEALGVSDGEAVADRLAAIRDALGLPATLRAAADRDGEPGETLAAAARATAADSLVANAPPAYDLDETAARRVLDDAW